jgi:hypothetical protein
MKTKHRIRGRKEEKRREIKQDYTEDGNRYIKPLFVYCVSGCDDLCLKGIV